MLAFVSTADEISNAILNPRTSASDHHACLSSRNDIESLAQIWGRAFRKREARTQLYDSVAFSKLRCVDGAARALRATIIDGLHVE